ncbi:MAG TPA: amidohydrolase family protein, partial [Halobacteriales archaeon]|nr:amidohydrolase family protein [Halobacteriales archaeon]
LMYASDYPHEDFDDPSAINELAFLTEEEKEGILGKNAEEVFGV